MRKCRLKVREVLATLGAAVGVACGGTDRSGPLPAQPWSLDARVASAGEGVPFCDEVTANVVEFMRQFEGQIPPSEAYGGTAVVAGVGEIGGGMNGSVSSSLRANQHQNFVNLMTLIQYDEELNPAPYLAERWEVAQGATELIFHIRDDVYWHDGERTDAYDVAFTFDVATNPDTGFPNSGFWTYYEHGPGAVEVIDSFTVKFRLQPHAEFMDPWRTVTIMPEHLLGDVDPTELAQHPFGTVCPVGNGPFIFTRHREDASWSFQANPAFPEGLGGRPYLDRYVFRVIPDQNTILADLLTETVDVYMAVKPDQAQRVAESEVLELLSFPFRSVWFVAWNSRRPQLADRRVRQAITLATNRAEMVDDLIQGRGVLANGTVPQFHWAYDADVGSGALPFDPDNARKLLEEAGWTDRDGDGVRENADAERLAITIKYSPNDIRRGIAELMQAQLGAVGIEVRPQAVEFITLLDDMMQTRNFDGAMMSWTVEFKLDDRDLFHSSRIESEFAFSGTHIPEIDGLIERLPLVADRAEAKPLWAEYQRHLVDEQPFTFLYFPDRLHGVNLRLTGVTMDVRGEWISIRDWKIAPKDRKHR